MRIDHQGLLDHHLPTLVGAESGEAALLPTLVRWLVRTGRLTSQTLLAQELPWLGRRVDLALMAGRGTTSAFELKIGRLQRVLEQATYNRSSFHRSWVVTSNQPRAEGLGWAQTLGVGVIVIRHELVQVLATPVVHDLHPAAVERLRRVIRTRGQAVA